MVEVVNNIEVNLQELEQEYISKLDDPQDIKTNKLLVTDMLKFMYREYVGILLNNKDMSIVHRYNDIKLIDQLFSCYTGICYKYKVLPSILQFSLFTGISRDTIKAWGNGTFKNISQDYITTVKKWSSECEMAQVNEKDVKSIFLLKACYNYNDNLSVIPVGSIEAHTEVTQLPSFMSTNNTIESSD